MNNEQIAQLLKILTADTTAKADTTDSTPAVKHHWTDSKKKQQRNTR